MSSSERDFDLSFQLSESEFCQAHRAHLRKSLLTVKNLVLLTMALGIGSIQARMFAGSAQNGPDWALRIFVGLWLAVIAFSVFAYGWMPGRVYRRDPRHSSTQRIATESDGFTWECEGSKQFVPWSEITRLSEAGRSVLLHRSQLIPIAVPFRAFPSDDDRARFHERVERARLC